MTSAAETPRVLDVRDFAQARETELRYLLQAVKQNVGEPRFGTPFLPRHLRRRATSHRRFSVRRRPNLRLAALYGSRITNIVTDGAADRLQALPAGCEGGAQGGNARTRAQRRHISSSAAAPADPAERDPGAAAAPVMPPGAEPGTGGERRPTNRRMRRRPAALQTAAEASCAKDLVSPPSQQSGVEVKIESVAAEALGAGGPDGGDGGLRRLETHVWHARRMVMERRWGHLLAAHAPGRGRGSRSLLAAARAGALLHDSSYLGCCELRGHQRELAELLRRISDPARLEQLLQRPELVSGAAEWSLFLHRPGAFPAQPLAPARAMWLTPAPPHPDLDDGRGAGSDGPQGPDAGSPSPSHSCSRAAVSMSAPLVDEEGWSTRCVLWLWVHAAAFGDVWQALQQAAAAGVDAADMATAAVAAPSGPLPVTIRSRCPDLRRIDVVGAAATAALARVLQPLATRGSGGEGCDSGDDDWAMGGSLWRSVTQGAGSGGEGAEGGGAGSRWRWRWPSGAVVGLVAADPRLTAPVRAGGTALQADALAEAEVEMHGRTGGVDGEGGEGGAANRGLRCLGEAELRQQLRQWPESGDWTLGASALWRTDGASSTPSSSAPAPESLAPSSSTPRIPPPLDQSQVSAVRQAARQRLLRAGLGGLADAPSAASTTGSFGVSFPALLVRRREGVSPWSCAGGRRRGRRRAGQTETAGEEGAAVDGPGGGWSLVLPARWVAPIWAALAFTGARPTGQSEWRQLATHFRTPCFPYDHPYTPAGARHNAEAAAELAAAASRRPLGHARRPADLGSVADWSRLMQPPPLPLRQLPVALKGGAQPGPVAKTPASREGADGGGGAEAMEVDAAAAGPSRGSDASPATSSGGGSRVAAAGGAVAARAGPGASSCTASCTDWAVALTRLTLRELLLGSNGAQGGDGGVEGIAAAPVAIPESARQQEQQEQHHRGQAVVRGQQPASKDSLHGWTLRKALKLGLVAPPPSTATATAPAEPQAVPLSQQQQQLPRGLPGTARQAATTGAACGRQAVPVPGPCGHQSRCLVYVTLRVEGRGVCEAGAEVIALPNIKPKDKGNGRGDSGSDGVDGSGDVPMADATDVGSTAAAASSAKAFVVGYVVSAVTRGSPAYPGGIALCDTAGLAAPSAPVVGLGSELGRGGGAEGLVGNLSGLGLGREGGARRGGGGVGDVWLWVRNPGSDALRACRAEVLLPGEESAARGGGAGARGRDTQLAWN